MVLEEENDKMENDNVQKEEEKEEEEGEDGSQHHISVSTEDTDSVLHKLDQSVSEMVNTIHVYCSS